MTRRRRTEAAPLLGAATAWILVGSWCVYGWCGVCVVRTIGVIVSLLSPALAVGDG